MAWELLSYDIDPKDLGNGSFVVCFFKIYGPSSAQIQLVSRG